MIILPAIKLFTLHQVNFSSRVFRQDIALKCLDILSTLVTSHPQHLHRVFRLLLPFALISKPSSSHVTFARAVVTSLLQHRTVGDFDWSKSAASINLYNSMLLRHNFLLLRFSQDACVLSADWLEHVSVKSSSSPSAIFSGNTFLTKVVADWFTFIGPAEVNKHYVSNN